MGNHSFYRHLLGTVCNVFEGYSSVLFLKDNSLSYSLVSYFSLGDSINPSSSVIPGKGLIGWIIKNQQPLVVNDFSKEKRLLCYYLKREEEKIKSFMGTPLPQGKGVLCVDSKKTYTFTPKDQKILYYFGRLVDSFISETERVQELEDTVNYYNALQLVYSLKEKYPKWDMYLIHLLKVLSAYTKFPYCMFVSRDERGTGYYLEKCNEKMKGIEGCEGKRFHINDGLIGWVFKHHRSIILCNQEDDRPVSSLFGKGYKGEEFQTIVCLPLVVNLKTRGVLIFLDNDRREIPDRLSEFFNLLICHMSLFLENLYLKDKLRKKKTKEKQNKR